MNINCVICSDLFDPGAEVFVTKCGHMFHYTCLMNWLERSKTCPQCRNKVTDQSIHRIYFNLANTDNSFTDVGSLVNKNESLQFQVTMKDKELKTLKEKAEKFKKQQVGLRQEVLDLESDIRTHEAAIRALKDQMSYFKERAKEADRLTSEIVRLKSKIAEMENVEVIINGSRDQANDILRNESNAESLAIYAAMLKKSLVDADLKKRESQLSLKKAQNEATKYKREFFSIEAKYAELKKEYESMKINNDKEKKYLKDKLLELDKKASTYDNSSTTVDLTNTTIMRIACESPVNFNRTPRLDATSEVINLDDSFQSESQKESATKETANVDSPYLQVKSSSLGDYNSLMNKYHATSSAGTSKQGVSAISKEKNRWPIASRKFSIFKPSEPRVEGSRLNLPSQRNKDIIYTGLGGSAKDEIYPSPKPGPTNLKRRKVTTTVPSHKFKKLAPSVTSKSQ